MTASPQPFTIRSARLVDRGRPLTADCLRVADGRIAAIGGPDVARPGDVVVDATGRTLLPGLIDAHVHLLPGTTLQAAAYGVTTVIDQFSKPEVYAPERAAVVAALRGDGPARADLRTSGIGATAPGGHPSMAYAPFPVVTGPGDAERFVADRIAEGSDHLKVIYDDGSGIALAIPSLTPATIEALVAAAHAHGLLVVAHASTSTGAVTVARAGVDVLAHVPFDRMPAEDLREVAASGVAVISTLAVIDGFPGADGRLPLLAEPIAALLGGRWRRVLDRQALRWTPPEPPDGAAARDNLVALLESGVRVLAGTDVPNPGLVPGASLHRELGHLVRAGLTPSEALAAATSTPAEVFGLTDRGRLTVGARADLLLADGDPTVAVEAAQRIGRTWVAGREVDGSAYAGSAEETAGLRELRRTTDRILVALRERWPDLPGPEEVRREDGEPLGQVVPTAAGWLPLTTFGAALGVATGYDEAVEVVRRTGLAVLAERWWARTDADWAEAYLVEVRPDRVRLRWSDPMTEQPPAGSWYELGDVDLSRTAPVTHEI